MTLLKRFYGLEDGVCVKAQQSTGAQRCPTELFKIQDFLIWPLRLSKPEKSISEDGEGKVRPRANLDFVNVRNGDSSDQS